MHFQVLQAGSIVLGLTWISTDDICERYNRGVSIRLGSSYKALFLSYCKSDHIVPYIIHAHNLVLKTYVAAMDCFQKNNFLLQLGLTLQQYPFFNAYQAL